ncbi:MAG: hypothetical protein DWQ36_20085 [Acidobacteria bacterium]|nr:MAG: hypothetical protein DWQ30_08280 [Acidobacteriota bacterium]REK03588.1 MAG: hypothetical protein DWQ36_20085 [Acidobacteriota bacterium]
MSEGREWAGEAELWRELGALWRQGPDDGTAPETMESPPSRPSAQALGAELARRVRRQILRAVAVQVLELLTAAAALWLALALLRGDGGAMERITALVIVTLVAVAAAYGVWNRRHAWRVRARTPHGHLEDLRRRNRARRGYLRFSYALLVAEVALFSVWIPLQRPDELVSAFAFLALWCGAGFLVLLRLNVVVRREAQTLERLAAELDVPDDEAAR